MIPDLKIIIVNWNLKQDTIACLESLLQAGAVPDHIILVDNGSQDGTIEAIISHFPEKFQYIKNEENLGFVIGSNQGISLALQQGAKWILLLNNDTIVAPDFMEQLAAAQIQGKQYSVLSPLIFSFDQPDRIWFSGDFLIPGTLITRNPYKGKKISKEMPDLLPTDFASGCAMLVHSPVFEQVGLLNPSLIMYGEEVDFCWRARQLGYKIACSTKATIWHKVSTSAKKDQPNSRYLKSRNQIRFYRNYSKGIQIPIMFLFSIIKSFQLVIYDLFHNQSELIPVTAKAWLDGWRGL